MNKMWICVCVATLFGWIGWGWATARKATPFSHSTINSYYYAERQGEGFHFWNYNELDVNKELLKSKHIKVWINMDSIIYNTWINS